MAFGVTIQHRTPNLQAGKLRHRVNIVTTSPAQDSTGGFSLQNTTLYATVWASVEALNGDEQFAAEQQVSKVTHQIIIRHIGAAPSWQPATNYLSGALVVDANGYLQQATGGGTSGPAAPTWASGLYALTYDGDPSLGVTWRNLDVAQPRSAINAAMQIVWQGRTFQITSVLNPTGLRKMLVLMCVEINDSNQQNTIVGGVAGGGGIGTVLDGGSF